MAESILHKKLISLIEHWILETFEEKMIIYCDSEDNLLNDSKPPMIFTRFPDVYAIGMKSNRVIVGEAKISQNDLESKHSEEQFTAYLTHCKSKKKAMTVLAVPIELINCAKSLIAFIKRKNNLHSVETQIVNPFLFRWK